jgi:hypothetical protein
LLYQYKSTNTDTEGENWYTDVCWRLLLSADVQK